MVAGSRAGYKDLSVKANDEFDVEGYEFESSAVSNRFKTKTRGFLSLLLVLAIVAGCVEAVRYASNFQKKSDVDENVDLWQLDKKAYCDSNNGTLHPLGKKCCDKDCGGKCGDSLCYEVLGNGNEIKSAQACCANKVPDCGPAQNAPCMIPVAATLGASTELYGALSFATTAPEGTVKNGVKPALAKYFGIPPTDIVLTRIVTATGRKLQGVVPKVAQVPPKAPLWSADFQITVYQTNKDAVQKKANDVYADHTPLQHELDTAITGVVSLMSFSSPKTTTPTTTTKPPPTTSSSTKTPSPPIGEIPPAPPSPP